jgi:hypothetical protein
VTAPVVAVLERRGYAGGEHEHPAHLDHRQHAEGDVVGVERGREPREVDPRPPDREEDLQERHELVEGVTVGQRVREAGRQARDRDHEREVEQQLELGRDAVGLVDRARRHPDACRSAHWKGDRTTASVCDVRGLSQNGGPIWSTR